MTSATRNRFVGVTAVVGALAFLLLDLYCPLIAGGIFGILFGAVVGGSLGALVLELISPSPPGADGSCESVAELLIGPSECWIGDYDFTCRRRLAALVVIDVLLLAGFLIMVSAVEGVRAISVFPLPALAITFTIPAYVLFRLLVAYGTRVIMFFPANPLLPLTFLADRLSRHPFFGVGGISLVFALMAGLPAAVRHFSDPLRNLADPVVSVRISAARELGRMRDGRAVDALISALSDGDSDVIGAARDALVEIGEPAVSGLSLRLNGPDESVRRRAAEILGSIGDARAVPLLIDALTDPHCRAVVIEALGQIGDARAVPPLIAYLKTGNQDVRWYASRALGQLGRAAVEPLAAYLTDKNEDVRKAATEALGAIGAPAVDTLLSGLQSEPAVRRAVAVQLGKIGDAQAISHLRAALPDWYCCRELVWAMEKLGWTPASDRDRVYQWIGREDADQLKSQWERVRAVLEEDIETGRAPETENSISVCIALGQKDLIPILIRTLDKVGTVALAEVYLNCGCDELETAAANWASQHGYQRTRLPGLSPNLRWGQW